jgi:hypothetical protein
MYLRHCVLGAVERCCVTIGHPSVHMRGKAETTPDTDLSMKQISPEKTSSEVCAAWLGVPCA